MAKKLRNSRAGIWWPMKIPNAERTDFQIIAIYYAVLSVCKNHSSKNWETFKKLWELGFKKKISYKKMSVVYKLMPVKTII